MKEVYFEIQYQTNYSRKMNLTNWIYLLGKTFKTEDEAINFIPIFVKNFKEEKKPEKDFIPVWFRIVKITFEVTINL